MELSELFLNIAVGLLFVLVVMTYKELRNRIDVLASATSHAHQDAGSEDGYEAGPDHSPAGRSADTVLQDKVPN